MSNLSYVTKRNGMKELVSFDKITERINRLIDKDPYLNPITIAMKVIPMLTDNISTMELDLLSADICMSLTTEHPNYSYLGGKILVSNLHKKTLSNFSDKMTLLYDNNIICKDFYDYVSSNKEILDSIISYEYDYNYDYFGFKTLEKSYLLKINDNIIERPQDMLLRVAITLQQGNLEKIKSTYIMMAQGQYTHASPTLYNAGTNHMQMSSCFLLGTMDDLTSITHTWNSCAQISKWAGGIGLSISSIRGKDSLIKGTNGRSNGIVPFLKVFNDIARWIDQGGKRPGSIAVYLEPHHPDIFEFLDLRKNFGSETERARDLFLALWISDLFMKQVESDNDWYLMSSDNCPGLEDVYGEAYESLYWSYVKENKYSMKISARKLWTAILQAQIETGMPYISYKDNVNKKSNHMNIGIIHCSNLCVHGSTKILTIDGYKEINSLENSEIKVWNGDEWSNVTVRKTGINKNLIRINLSNGAYIDCTPEHKFYIQTKSRAECKPTEIIASELKIGDKLIKYNLPEAIEFKNNEEFKYAYTHGAFCGDGTTYDNYSTTKKYPKLYLYGEKKKLLKYIVYESYTENHTNDRYNIVLPKDLAPKFTVPFQSSINDRLRWFEGYCDTDGTIARNGSNESLQICSINKDFLINIRLMLHTLGIESKVTLMFNERQVLLPDGKGDKKLFNCKKAYRLLISSTGLYNLSKLGFSPKRLIFKETNPQRCAEQFVRVLSIENSYQNVDTFCFTEPLKHKGIFNGILTGQCNEIVQYSDNKEYAVCNLASISLTKFVKKYSFDMEFVIYTKDDCKYCDYAKNYLKSNNTIYKEIPYSEENYNTLKVILKDKNNNITFPQIFLNRGNQCEYIGGWSELYKKTGGTFNFESLYETAYAATVNLNNVIDINYYPVPETKISNMKHRPIGLGIQGLADTLALMRIPFDSDEAVELNAKIMETIYLASMTASNDMSKARYNMMKDLISIDYDFPFYYDSKHIITDTRLNTCYHMIKPCKYELKKDINSYTIGAYSTFDGSPLSRGLFQFDMWNYDNNKLMYREKWDILRESVMKYGVRNSMLTALMPTASTSQILGNNECFEAFTSNIYSRKTQAGTFTMVCKYLVDDLISIGLWSKELKDNIIAHNGSVQNLNIPSEIKAIYKTIWEIKQIWVLKGAVARGPFVDQTQSMNIFMAEPDFIRLGSSHFWAWKNGLKTGMYYLRTKPSSDAVKFTIDPLLVKDLSINSDCINCSA